MIHRHVTYPFHLLWDVVMSFYLSFYKNRPDRGFFWLLAPHSKSSKSVNQGRFDVNIRAHSTAHETGYWICSREKKRQSGSIVLPFEKREKSWTTIGLDWSSEGGKWIQTKNKKDDAEGLWLSRAEEPWRDTRLVSFPVFHKIIKCDQTLFFFATRKFLKKPHRK